MLDVKRIRRDERVDSSILVTASCRACVTVVVLRSCALARVSRVSLSARVDLFIELFREKWMKSLSGGSIEIALSEFIVFLCRSVLV